MLAAFVLSAIGCGDNNIVPDARAIDARPDASTQFACSGQALPTTAPVPLTISGTTIEIAPVGVMPLGDVQIDGFLLDGTALPSTTSDAQGAFTWTYSGDGTARAGYLRATKASYPVSYGYAATPAYRNVTGSALPLVSAATIDTLANTVSITRNPSLGVLAIRAIDCDRNPLSGVTIATTPPGTVIYFAMGFPSTSATSTDASGQAYVFDVPVGDVMVSGTHGAITMRGHQIGSFAGSPTFTDLQP